MTTFADVVQTGVTTGLLGTYVAYPAIVKKVNTDNQTITAQIAIQRIVDGKNEDISVLVGVPLVFPTVQGFHITMPIQVDDEVLVVFADRCIDAWWDAGGVRKQAVHRVHNISDGFALIGVNSKPNAVTNYNSSDLEIRNNDGSQKIALTSSGDINITTSANVNVTAATATVNADSTINGDLTVNGEITASGDVTGAGVSLETHTHGGVLPGGANTAPPN